MEMTSVIFGFAAVLIMTWITAQGLAIIPNAKKKLVALGGEQELDCFHTYSPNMNPKAVVWKGPSGANYTLRTMTESTYTYHNILTIDRFTEKDVGIYKCTFGEDLETQIELFTAIENKIEPEFFFGNKSAILECIVTFPHSSVQGAFWDWLKDNSSLSNLKKPERFTQYPNGTLLISNPTRADSGVYQARYNVTGVDDVDYKCDVVYSAGPLVLDMAKSENIEEGSTLSLLCEVKGYPPANITWTKDKVPIQKESDRVTITTHHGPEGDLLEVRSATVADAGVYACWATDPYTQKSSNKSITVRVKDKLEWLWPVIGILCEIVVLAIVIFACSKIKKDEQVERPADEREGLLRQGSGRNRDHDKHE